jgi:cytochrome c6
MHFDREKMRKEFTYAVALLFLLLANADICAKDTAKPLYQNKCAMCHGADGKGDTAAGKAMKAHDFHSPEIVKMSNAELIAITTQGKGSMPGYGGKLSAPEIDSLVAYIRTLQKE